MTILVTGFEPFGGAAVNASWEAVRLLPDQIGNVRLVRRQLPVEYDRAGQLAREAAAACGADLVLAVGVAGGRKAVTPELVAVNWRMASIPDNAGAAYSGEMIDPDAPAARMTRLPVLRLVEAIRAADVPCQLSLSAGAYVCNDLYWRLLTDLDSDGCRCLFVHVPTLDDLSAGTVSRGLAACIAAMADA